MLALTVHQPWAAAIAGGAKLVENRDWRPPVHARGQLIAIHAGKKEPALDDVEEVERLAGRPYDYYLGVILAVARLDGYVEWAMDLPEDQRRWFVGDYGWRLSDVQQLGTLVVCRGMQGLWKLPDDVFLAVEKQLQLKLPEVG